MKKITFNKIKKSGEGYIADNMFVPRDKKNRHYQIIQSWIKNGGNVISEFTVDDIKSSKISDIKNEALKRIKRRYNDINQINILMSQDASQINEMSVFIKDIRDQSNFLEGQVVDMDLDQLNSFNPESDDYWN